MARITALLFSATVILCLQTAWGAETLKVQVTDSRTGAPVRATVIAVGTPPTLISRVTDRNGAALLELPSLDRVSVVVRTDTHGVKCFGPEATKSGNLIVTLEPALRVYGVVYSPEGMPASSVTVKVAYSGQDNCRVRPRERDEVTNERGEYVLRNVDVSRDFTIVLRHDVYGERQISKDELLSRFSGPSETSKQVDVSLTR